MLLICINTGKSAISLLAISIFSKLKTNQIHRTNKQCLILGNGPSLNTDAAIITNQINTNNFDVWAVNYFAKTTEYEIYQPTHYVLADPSFWIEDISSIKKSARNSLALHLNQKTKWSTLLFIPFESKNSSFLKAINNPCIKVIHYNNTPCDGFDRFLGIILDWRLGMLPPYNVMIPTLILAIQARYERVIIFGADHSWHENIQVNSNSGLTVNQKHFYDNQENPAPFSATNGRPFTIGEVFYQWSQVFLHYQKIQKYSEKKEVKVLNCSHKSYIDAFQRFE